ncbi:AHH domain-containing protein [Aquabacterium sp.]|uniref:AHH domain-containing protein n=1 Tax=Aquabacterium sp. TaxID=1872578 RepID=UPI003783E8A8
MTQLGEMVKAGFVDDFDVDCPFHEKKHTCDGTKNNYQAGDAKTLGENLDDGSAGTSTVQRDAASPDNTYRSPEKFVDPDEAYDEETREVQIVAGNDNCIYPVAYSAHHLIPAKESLKRATKLHKFIDKGKGAICCNLGYDVDGNENGVWLPGLHAVNSKGLNLWGAASTDLPDDEEVGRKAVKRAELEDRKTKWTYSPLDGPKPSDGPAAFASTNMKWMYVQAAMNFAPVGKRQFHDRHPDYSGKVCEHLEDVATVLEGLLGLGGVEPSCKKCKDAKGKPVPPIALLGMLNGSSRWFRGKLVGTTRDSVYYTSSWCGPAAPAPALVIPRKRKRGSSK